MLVALVSSVISCSGTPEYENRETARLDASRSELLVDQSGLPGGKSAPAYPAGEKNFLEPVMSTVEGRPCEGNDFSLNELSVKNVGLSNRDILSAAHLLNVMGYNTRVDEVTEDASSFAKTTRELFGCADLPLVIVPRTQEETSLTLSHQERPDGYVGAGGQVGTGNLAFGALRRVHAVDLDQMMIFYHEENAAKVERLEETLRNVIDTPSAQVYIETMVLEVSEEDSKELGVSYSTANIGGADGNNLLNLGVLEVGDGDTVGFERDTTRDEDGNFNFVPGVGIQAKVRALVDSGRAEILARPSVLALSNRQAVIQIVDVVQTPILQSTLNSTGELVISAYEFEPLLLGITLNLRPRVSADRQWISLEIDATVEAEIDENSGVVYSPDGEGGRIELAEKKGSAARKVKTFARIPDRVPIIIGGLVAGNQEKQSSRVPVLGALPFVGGLFGATDNEVQKREIVIVLTPHVLAEDAVSVRANQASKEVMQRQSDLELFNNYYKIRPEDVYNLNFLLEDRQFAAYRRKALKILDAEPDLATNPAIRPFAEDRIPGDDALVTKMVFDIIASDLRREEVDPASLYLSLADDNGSQRLSTLADVLDGVNLRNGKDAVQLTFGESPGGQSLVQHRRVSATAPLRDIYGSSLVLRTESDLQRLMTSIATDVVIGMNGGFPELNVQTFREGRSIQLAGREDYSGYMLSSRTAQIFYESRHVREVLKRNLASAYQGVDSAAEGIITEG